MSKEIRRTNPQVVGQTHVQNAHTHVASYLPGSQSSPIAQLVERSAVNRKVGGSSPPGRVFFALSQSTQSKIKPTYK